MIFYHAQGSCSEGIRLMLQMAGARFETQVISLAAQDQRQPEFLAMNPKGKVPALRLPSGEVITEYPVIAAWIAETYPDAGLLPQVGEARREAMSWIEYIVATLHMRGASFVFKPSRFTAVEAAHPDLVAHGRAVIQEGYAKLSERLGDAEWFGETPGALDATAYFITAWGPRLGVDLPENLAALQARLAAQHG